ncbi:MAG: hypothetical protein MZW92_74360 [Comamonadaceae bacterium]|nr:hypothetical protein [Comamonadaceae bacterium]
MSFTETIAAGRAFAAPGRPADQRQPRAGRHRGGQSGRRAARRDAGRRRHLADRGRALRGRAVAEGVAGDRGRRAGHHAAAGAAAGPAAERHAGGGRHRLLGRADPAGGVPRHPQRAHDGVPLGADRLRSACWCSARCKGIVVAIIVSMIGLASQTAHPRVSRHRPQARRRRAAAAVARAPRRRDLRGPADRAAGGAPVLRQRAERRRSRSARWSRSTSRACWRWT